MLKVQKLAVTKPLLVFNVVWLGQLISMIGSGLTGFALGVWVFKDTGSVTQFALIALFTTLPGVLISPLAGSLADRWNRRLVMILSDSGSAMGTLSIALLYGLGWLEIWHIYIAMSFSSICGAFQWPAYSAATTQLVPKRHYGRASGMVQLGYAISQLVSPALAGVLFEFLGLKSVIIIDFITFLAALLTLFIVRFPDLEITRTGKGKQESIWRELTFGIRYLGVRHGLLTLLIFFAVTNYSLGIIQVLITPLVLSFSTASQLGVVLSVAGCGMLAGTILMTSWGGPKRRIHGILFFSFIQGMILLLGGITPSLLLIGSAAFIFLFCQPIIVGCSQAIWQCKVEPDLQGRVFAVRSMIAMSTMPVAYVTSGPLVDFLFDPLMAENGLLANSVGRFISVGPGRGIGLFFIVQGLIILFATLVGFSIKKFRNLEDDLSDFETSERIEI